MYWNGFLSTLNFIFMSFGPFFAPTRTIEPISVNNLGKSPAIPSLNKLIWTSSHCQDFLVGEMKTFNEPTIPSAINTAAVNVQRLHNHSRKQQNSNKNRLKKHRIENHHPSHIKNNLASKSTDVISINQKFNSANKNNHNENLEPSDQK